MAMLRIPRDVGPLAPIVARKIIDIYRTGEWNASQLVARALRELVDDTDRAARLRTARQCSEPGGSFSSADIEDQAIARRGPKPRR
jgi:hypothetical protein